MKHKTRRIRNGAARGALFAVLLAPVVLVVGCSIMPQEQQPLEPPLVQPAPIHYDTVQVQRGTIIREVTGSAQFVSTKQVELSYKEQVGRIAEITIQSGQSVHKGQVLMRLDSSDSAFQLGLAQIALQKSQIQVDELKRQGADSNQIDMAKLDEEAERLKVQYLERQIAKTILTAPIDGIVTHISSHKIGDSVEPYENLITISDVHQLALSFSSTDTQTASSIVVGMPVNILYGKEKILGKVTQVDSNDTTYSTDILIEPNLLPPNAKMGQSADFQIVIEKKDNVVYVPKQAVRTVLGDNYVHVLKGQTVLQVPVQIGVQDGINVEIVSGVQPGQTVILQ